MDKWALNGVRQESVLKYIGLEKSVKCVKARDIGITEATKVKGIRSTKRVGEGIFRDGVWFGTIRVAHQSRARDL